MVGKRDGPAAGARVQLDSARWAIKSPRALAPALAPYLLPLSRITAPRHSYGTASPSSERDTPLCAPAARAGQGIEDSDERGGGGVLASESRTRMRAAGVEGRWPRFRVNDSDDGVEGRWPRFRVKDSDEGEGRWPRFRVKDLDEGVEGQCPRFRVKDSDECVQGRCHRFRVNLKDSDEGGEGRCSRWPWRGGGGWRPFVSRINAIDS